MNIEKGTTVFVSEEGQEATITSIASDGMVEVVFSDGEAGSYSTNEVEEI